MRRRVPIGLGILVAAVACGALLQAAGHAKQMERSSRRSPLAAVRRWTIEYRAHDGHTRAAYVLLPAWYGPKRNPPLPLIISPHGRGVDGRANAGLWGRLKGWGRFAVVNPDGEGRRLPLYSWGARGQIADLARMPALVRRALPWLRLKPDSTYVVAGSMGGQEALLLVARAPRLLDGAAVIDSPTDFALQYSEFPNLPCDAVCHRRWNGPIGPALQRLAQIEVGGSPKQVPSAYQERSPLHYVEAIARSGVPLGLWWSRSDRLVPDPARQELRFLRALQRRHPRASLVHVIGRWSHVHGMRLNLPRALAWLHLSQPAAPK